MATHNYVILEAAALVHHRLGASAARALLEDVAPSLSVLFVDQVLHRRAASAYLAGIRRGSSLVDQVSFEMMRDLAIDRVFAFDRDFRREGFETVP